MHAAVGDAKQEREEVASVDCESGEHYDCRKRYEHDGDVPGNAHVVEQPADVVHAAEREHDNRADAEVRLATFEVNQ